MNDRDGKDLLGFRHMGNCEEKTSDADVRKKINRGTEQVSAKGRYS